MLSLGECMGAGVMGVKSWFYFYREWWAFIAFLVLTDWKGSLYVWHRDSTPIELFLRCSASFRAFDEAIGGILDIFIVIYLGSCTFYSFKCPLIWLSISLIQGWLKICLIESLLVTDTCKMLIIRSRTDSDNFGFS